ncbi:hypothetical protein EAH78_23545 [Pseudomonas arsenicoxydans]|uniref:Uncharacterized protein n=1 Tax=Pseudomonas arsenicoxydans TaxID=702115 RepID=A0A502HLG8_9PSED|nr:hypothetical protein EAH78_23545 [Pseudomonas arsenicoxydans]
MTISIERHKRHGRQPRQIPCGSEFLWRASLLALGCVAAPFVSAAHSSGSKLPRHKSCFPQVCLAGF